MEKIKIQGIVSLKETSFIGFDKHQSMIEKFGDVINENYKKLENLVSQEKLSLTQESFEKSTLCFYYSVNPQEPYMAYFINAVEADYSKLSVEKILAEKLVVGVLLPQKKLLKIIYTGHPQNLGEAWQTADAYVAQKGWLRNSGSLPFERYVKQDGENSITEIYIPIL